MAVVTQMQQLQLQVDLAACPDQMHQFNNALDCTSRPDLNLVAQLEPVLYARTSTVCTYSVCNKHTEHTNLGTCRNMALHYTIHNVCNDCMTITNMYCVCKAMSV